MIADNSNQAERKDANGALIAYPSPQQILLARSGPTSPRDAPVVKPSAILNSLRRSWKLALPLSVCLAAVGAIAGWKLIVPMYIASAFLRVDADVRPLIFETADHVARAPSFDLYQNTQKQLLLTPFVLNAALRDEEIANLSAIKTSVNPVAWLQEELAVDFPDNGEIMRISLETESPTACIKLVNAVVSAYMNEVVVADRNERLHRLDSLERVYSDAEAKVRNKRAELKTLASALRTGDSESLTVAQQTALQQYAMMQEKLSSMQFDLMQAEGELEIARQVLDKRDQGQQPESDPKFESSELELLATSGTSFRTPDISQLEDEIVELNTQLSSTTFGESHPSNVLRRKMLALKEQLLERRIAEAKEQQQFELNRAIAQQQERAKKAARQSPTDTGEFDLDSLAARVDVFKHHRETLQEKVNQLDQETRQLGQSSIDIELMRSEIESLEEVLRRVGDEMERTSIELKPKSRIELISPAESASPPNMKKRYALAAAAGMTGLFAPFLLGIFWDLQRHRVNDAESASKTLSLSIFGTIPRISGDPLNGKRRGNKRYQRQHMELNESVDGVVGLILQHARTKNHKIFMVSSALPAEGKSTVSCQLAQGLARSGKQVALIDFDLRRPSIDRYMNLADAPGVAEVLHDQVDLDVAFQQTDTPNLSVLVAGKNAGHLHELWTSSALEEMFDEFRNSFDIVIVDACPVLPVVDARIIGTYCDGVILTLIRDTSRLPAAARAVEMLKSYGVDVLGTIVIGVDPSSYYSSYTYRGYQPLPQQGGEQPSSGDNDV